MIDLIDYLFPEILNLLMSEYFSVILVMFMLLGAFKLVKKVLNI